jgi:hypothetical protein
LDYHTQNSNPEKFLLGNRKNLADLFTFPVTLILTFRLIVIEQRLNDVETTSSEALGIKVPSVLHDTHFQAFKPPKEQCLGRV